MIFGRLSTSPQSLVSDIIPLSKFLPTAKYARRAAAKGGSAASPQAPSFGRSTLRAPRQLPHLLKTPKGAPMTLLYLITAIFTMLSLVLSVRRVPRTVTVLQAVAFACAVALFIHYLAK